MKFGFIAVLIGTLTVGVASAQQGQVPAGETALGSVRLTHNVMADGKPLKAGTYQVRLTSQDAAPPAAGIKMERWVEFLQAGKVAGREVVSIVPQAELKELMPGPDSLPRAGSGSARVEMLKGNDYVRVWINRGGVHYLIHMPPA
jgi:hypothetical protein